MFVRVPGPKGAKNRFHPDLTSEDWPAEADRIGALGATRVGVIGVRWTALVDPEGNEFNIFAPALDAGSSG